jgi:hypothetical protein
VSKALAYLIAAIIALSLLASATPMLTKLAHTATSLIVLLVVAAVVLRLVWYFTNRY